MATIDRVPFGGRFFAILNVEGEGDMPVLIRSKDDANTELARRRALPEDHDDHATEYHQVFLCDVAGVIWNSYDPDPRADNPLTPEEIVAVHDGREVDDHG